MKITLTHDGLDSTPETPRPHLPNVPLDGHMRHIGLVNDDGEVLLTVWNHHDHHACSELAEAIKTFLEGRG